ncbi:porin [Achromobacter sp. GG226]|uniref:porin n=1 Tax=Verticiella alkaliphila TaxID=2779529 RepID=UPI001C0BF904|nr:porin [Verticiella sp. GG226]MBU4612888.1 porin [Verticiella sp. GG226]
MKFKTACLAASLAAAGLATTGMAHAQSSVTLYGIVDVNIEAYNNAPDASGGSKTVTGMRSGGLSGSRWGLRGVEDLGNGLKAVFQLESGFNIGNGNSDGRMFQRTAMAGLEGNWGRLTFGRQYTPAFTMLGQYVPGAYGAQYEPIPRIVPSRADNAVLYSARVAGLAVGAYYAFRNQADQLTPQDLSPTGAFGGAVGYSFGNTFRVMAAYDRVNQPAVAAGVVPTVGKTHNAMAGARLDLNQFKILGGYRYRKVESLVGPDIKSDFYMIGAGWQVNAQTGLGVAYYHERFKDAPVGYLGTTDDKWHQVSLLASYGLSKRTNLYAVAAHARKGPLNLGFAGDQGTPYALAAGKTNQTGGAIGLRHQF